MNSHLNEKENEQHGTVRLNRKNILVNDKQSFTKYETVYCNNL